MEVWSCSSGLKQEAPPEFKASLGYTVSLRSPWTARQNSYLLKERKQEEKLKYTMTKRRGSDSHSRACLLWIVTLPHRQLHVRVKENTEIAYKIVTMTKSKVSPAMG